MLNKVQLIGRLGKDPEVRNLESGKAVANFSIACSEKWKDRTSGEVKEKTEWVNLVAWDPLADKVIARYLHKGDLVYIEGKLQTRSWEKDGVTRYTTEVLVSSLIMLSTKRDGDQSRQQSSASSGGYTTSPATPGSGATDDLPF